MVLDGTCYDMSLIFYLCPYSKKVVVAKIATATHHDAMPQKTQKKSVLYYNLADIISAGYPIKRF